jgi:hypothetical protein
LSLRTPTSIRSIKSDADDIVQAVEGCLERFFIADIRQHFATGYNLDTREEV